MTITEYIQAVNDPGRAHGMLGPLDGPRIYRVQVPRRPPASPGSAPRRPAPARRAAPPAKRPLAFADGSPALLCKACGGEAPVNARFLCAPCAAEVRWMVTIERSGLRVAW